MVDSVVPNEIYIYKQISLVNTCRNIVSQIVRFKSRVNLYRKARGKRTVVEREVWHIYPGLKAKLWLIIRVNKKFKSCNAKRRTTVRMASRLIGLISEKTNCTCSTLFLLIGKKQICTCSTHFCLSLSVVLHDYNAVLYN